MRKIIKILTAVITASCLSLNAYAAEILDKNYIESEIWADIWHGKNDDGKTFPEASFKHYILDQWIDENYGSDDYNWSSVGEVKYKYNDYYNRLIEDWNFKDDRNGNWTIDTTDNSYRFQIIGGQWNMIDKNGDTVLMFPIFSTIKDDSEKPNSQPANDKGSGGNRVIGNVLHRAETPAESLDISDGKVTDDDTATASESDSARSESVPLPYIVGGLTVIGVGTAAVVIYKKRK